MPSSRSPAAARRYGHRRRPGNVFGFSPFARCLRFSHGFSAAASSVGDGIADPSPPLLKRLKVAEPLISGDFEASTSSGEEELDTVQADFAFYDPKPSDFHGVKLLLKKYLDTRSWDVSGFTDIIISQTTVGTVVKMAEDDDTSEQAIEDDEGLFAVISALNLGKYNEHKCINELKKFILDVCKDEAVKCKLNLLFGEQADDMGLIVSQRFVNFPFELVPPIYEGLFKEISWATEDEPTEELRNSFRFRHYLLITRFFERKTPNKLQRKHKDEPDESIIYVKEEDEIFRELSSWSFTFEVHAEQSNPDEMKNYKEKGLVMLIEAEDIPKFEDKLKALVGQP